ncbi:MAG: ABC transporter ATP-binding protein [Treponema sp.]|nr:ABC transporter ATP-binding protein [Treponema sp.]
MGEYIINLLNIKKSFGQSEVLNKINLSIRRNEFLTLLGPSGCGKTTTLRIIGGFEHPTEGDLLFEGQSILKVPPYKRKVNTVFQKYALFPNMNVSENIAFGLKIKKESSSVIRQKVDEMLNLVNLKGFDKRSIRSLSGGQQQRVAIARALVNKPDVLLLDEPLGALDLKLRKDMQIELKNMQQELGITFVYVTHDQEEALTMSDTIAVMNEGEIQQIGTPLDIYNEPKNVFVANFIGESNILSGIMRKDFLVNFADTDFVCVDKGFENNEAIDAVVRPEDVKLVDEEKGMIKGVVNTVIFKGVHYEMLISTPLHLWKVHSTVMSEKGKKIGMVIEPDLIHVMKRNSNINLLGDNKEIEEK